MATSRVSGGEWMTIRISIQTKTESKWIPWPPTPPDPKRGGFFNLIFVLFKKRVSIAEPSRDITGQIVEWSIPSEKMFLHNTYNGDAYWQPIVFPEAE